MTGVPSGARTDSGTPKYARKYRDAVSRSISLGPWVVVTTPMMPYGRPYGPPGVVRSRRMRIRDA
ncbi:hypothetical protein GCM10028832_15210 [Streptomyces sparsus]